jgi:hypothetical protein
VTGLPVLRYCRCGALRDRYGFCEHCDRAPACGVTCERCAQRDSWCTLCRTWLGTRSAAQVHEISCKGPIRPAVAQW